MKSKDRIGKINNSFKNLTLQQNVFLATKISEEIFFVTKNTALVTKYKKKIITFSD